MTNTKQVAIVTGASRGIGAAIAERLARDSYRVVVNYSESPDKAQQVVEQIIHTGGEAIVVKADVASSAEVRALFEQTIQTFGRVDVLVNNAGIMPPQMALLVDTDDATFDRIFDINVKGTFNTLREAARRMEQGGRIINFSSSVIGSILTGYAVYGATKGAIEVLTRMMARELRGRDITINAIAPGPTATDLFLNGKTPEMIESLAKAAPLERLGIPEDIANAVAFLVGPDGAWVNGQTLRVNGGLL